jgi:hypothetical protein
VRDVLKQLSRDAGAPEFNVQVGPGISPGGEMPRYLGASVMGFGLVPTQAKPVISQPFASFCSV